VQFYRELALVAALVAAAVAFGYWLACRNIARLKGKPFAKMELNLFSQEDAQEFFEMFRDSGRKDMQEMGSEMLAVYGTFCKHRRKGLVMVMRDLLKPDAADEVFLFHMEDEPSPVKSNVVPFRPRRKMTGSLH
jgi:hypothetical protein